MKKLLLIILMFVSTIALADDKKGYSKPWGDANCTDYQLIVYGKTSAGVTSQVLSYCTLDEAMTKLAVLKSAQKVFFANGTKVSQAVFPLFNAN